MVNQRKQWILRMAALLGCLLLADALVTIAQAEAKTAVGGKATEATIRKFMQASAAMEMSKVAFEQMLEQFAALLPKVPATYWANAKRKASYQSLMTQMIPVYQKHFTETDMQQMMAFYESPVGKKLVKVQPFILEESMEIGSDWGERLSAELMDDLKKQGYLDEQKPAADAKSKKKPLPAKN